VGPADGEPALSGPATVRIIEDGSTTSHRYLRDLRELTAAGQPPPAELITGLTGRYATGPATAAGG
jgi:hypothetical protein